MFSLNHPCCTTRRRFLRNSYLLRNLLATSLHMNRSDISSPAKVSTCTMRGAAGNVSFNARPADLFVARFYRLCAAVHCRVIIRSPDALARRGENSELFPHLFPHLSSIVPRSRRICFRPATPPVADTRIRSVRKTRSMLLAGEDRVHPGVVL